MIQMKGKQWKFRQEPGFMQGIFMEYGITVDDEVEEIRNRWIRQHDKIAGNDGFCMKY